MLKLIVLGSGSAGNCAVVCTGTSRLLIDAGLSASRILERLAVAGVAPDTLSGIFITHEHGDHCRGLDVLTRRHPLPILCNAHTREVLKDSLRPDKYWHLIPSSGAFAFAGMELETFPVPHDAADPVGLVLRHGDAALGLLSDVGHANAIMRQKLRDIDTLFIEANYDNNLLALDQKRPWSTKQRIQGRHGHLSNDQTATLVAEILTPRLERVVLGHLSQDCNSPDLATTAVMAVLTALERADIHVACAPAHEPTPWFPVRLCRPAPTVPLCFPASVPSVPAPAPPRPPAQSVTPSMARWQQLELL